MRGSINLPVKLKIVRGTEKEVKEFTIVRDLIHVQSAFRRVGEPVKAPSGLDPKGVAFSPDGKLAGGRLRRRRRRRCSRWRTLRWRRRRSPPEVTATTPDGQGRVVPRRTDAVRGRRGDRRCRAVLPFRLGPERSRRRTAHDLLRRRYRQRTRRCAGPANLYRLDSALPRTDGRQRRTPLDRRIPDPRPSLPDRRDARHPRTARSSTSAYGDPDNAVLRFRRGVARIVGPPAERRSDVCAKP